MRFEMEFSVTFTKTVTVNAVSEDAAISEGRARVEATLRATGLKLADDGIDIDLEDIEEV